MTATAEDDFVAVVFRQSACRSICSLSTSTAIWGSALVLRYFSVLVSSWDRTERYTAALARTGGRVSEVDVFPAQRPGFGADG